MKSWKCARSAAIIASMVAAAACGSFGENDSPAPSPEAGTDANATEDGADGSTADAVTGAVDAGALLNAAFENGDFTPCGAIWMTQMATLAVVPTGRNGGSACKVCSTGGPGVFYGLRAPLAASVGKRYVGSAWVEATPTTDQKFVFVQLEYLSSDGGPSVAPLNQLVSAKTWVEYKVAATTELESAGFARLGFFLGSQGTSAGECFLLDDVVVQEE